MLDDVLLVIGEPRRMARLDAPAAYALTENEDMSENVDAADQEVETAVASLVIVVVAEPGFRRRGSICVAETVGLRLVVAVGCQSMTR